MTSIIPEPHLSVQLLESEDLEHMRVMARWLKFIYSAESFGSWCTVTSHEHKGGPNKSAEVGDADGFASSFFRRGSTPSLSFLADHSGVILESLHP